MLGDSLSDGSRQRDELLVQNPYRQQEDMAELLKQSHMYNGRKSYQLRFVRSIPVSAHDRATSQVNIAVKAPNPRETRYSGQYPSISYGALNRGVKWGQHTTVERLPHG